MSDVISVSKFYMSPPSPFVLVFFSVLFSGDSNFENSALFIVCCMFGLHLIAVLSLNMSSVQVCVERRVAFPLSHIGEGVAWLYRKCYFVQRSSMPVPFCREGWLQSLFIRYGMAHAHVSLIISRVYIPALILYVFYKQKRCKLICFSICVHFWLLHRIDCANE